MAVVTASIHRYRADADLRKLLEVPLNHRSPAVVLWGNICPFDVHSAVRVAQYRPTNATAAFKAHALAAVQGPTLQCTLSTAYETLFVPARSQSRRTESKMGRRSARRLT
jgi:hypothetical protein